MGGKSGQTIGYRYRHLLFEIWAQNVDTLHRFVAGGKRAWTGCVHVNETIQINAPAIWGDDEDNGEGGIVGPMDVQFGLADQPINARMLSILGERQTGNRGWFSTVFEGIFGSYVPNPKTRAVLLERIHAGWPGGEAWYPGTAAIPIYAGTGGSESTIYTAHFLATGQRSAGLRAIVRPMGVNGAFLGDDDLTTSVAFDSTVSACRRFGEKVFSFNTYGSTFEVTVASMANLTSWSAGPSGLPPSGTALPGAAVGTRMWISYDGDGLFYLDTPDSASFVQVDEFGGDLIRSVSAHEHSVMCISVFSKVFASSGNGEPGTFTEIANLFSPNQMYVERGGCLDNRGGVRWLFAGRQEIPSYTPAVFYTDSLAGPFLQATLPLTGNVQPSAVKYCHGQNWLVAMLTSTSASDGLFWSNDDGVNFEPVTLPESLYFGSAWGQSIAVDATNGRVMIAGQVNGTDEVKFYYTDDFENWFEVDNADTETYGVAEVYSPGVYAPPGGCPISAMNPAHIIRYMLTQKKKIPDAMLSDASFEYAADVLFAEGFGLCEEFDPDGETPEAFILRICDIIGACCTQSKTDGLIYLDLLRNDYDKETLPQLTDDDIVDWQDEQAVPAELTNSVQIGWRDVLVDSGLERITPPVKALGHIRTHGREMNQVIDMRGIPFEGIAMRVAKRELDTRSKPLVRLTLTTLRKHTSLRPGQPLLINCPKRGRVDTVVRVGEVDHGTPTDARIRWVLLQDVFDLPATVEIDPTTIHDGDEAPAEADAEVAIEAPYVELVATLPAERMAEVGEESGYLLTGVTAPTRGTNYAIHSKLASEAYERRAFADFTPTALTFGDALPLDTAVDLVSGNLLNRVEVGSWALWEDEIIRVDGIDVDNILTMGRGCADTVPAAHAAGTRLYFLGDWNGTDQREYAIGDDLLVKLPVRTGSDEQPLADKDTLQVIFAQRQFRPYPPGNLLLNGEPFYASGAIATSPPGGGGGGGSGGGGPVDPPPPGSDAPNTGDPKTDPGHAATYHEQGFPPNGFVGEPYHVNATGPDSFIWKGGIGLNEVAPKGQGSLGANVMAHNLSTGPTGEIGLHIYGIPLTAETVASTLAFESSGADASPTAGAVVGSVTFAAQPAYALMDFSERGTSWSYGHIWGGGIDPWCTCYVWNGGSQQSRAEFTTGKVRFEIEVSGDALGSKSATIFGLVVGPPRNPLYTHGPGAGSRTKTLVTPGIYAVEVDATVNPATITWRNAAGTSIGTATLNRPSGEVFRFYWYSGENGVTVRCNMGNWSWDTPVTSGFGGLPNMPTVVAAQWSRLPSGYTGSISSGGKLGPMLELGAGSAVPVMPAFGKSTGFHKIGFYDQSRTDVGRVGLCTASTPGQLGTTGDSIGYRNSNIAERFHLLEWTFGGGGSAILPAGFGTPEEGLTHSRPTFVVFAYNATAAEIEVWIYEPNDYGSTWRLWVTVTGVPAGTYFPAMTASGLFYSNLLHDCPEPSTADPWYTTP